MFEDSLDSPVSVDSLQGFFGLRFGDPPDAPPPEGWTRTESGEMVAPDGFYLGRQRHKLEVSTAYFQDELYSIQFRAPGLKTDVLIPLFGIPLDQGRSGTTGLSKPVSHGISAGYQGTFVVGARDLSLWKGDHVRLECIYERGQDIVTLTDVHREAALRRDETPDDMNEVFKTLTTGYQFTGTIEGSVRHPDQGPTKDFKVCAFPLKGTRERTERPFWSRGNVTCSKDLLEGEQYRHGTGFQMVVPAGDYTVECAPEAWCDHLVGPIHVEPGQTIMADPADF